MTLPFPSAACLLSAVALSLVAACSSADPEAKTTTPTGNEKRDTEVKHETCDGSAASAVKVDVNGDGKNDIVHVMKGDKEVCRIVDLNLDGYPDSFIYYEPDGKTERRRESDFDRDGRVDEIAVSERGQITLKLRETNFDNKLDTWDIYEGARLAKRERDTDGDGIIDQWWTYNNPTNPKCAVVASDRNADGKPDPDSVVDLCGEAYTAPKDPSAPAPTTSAKAAPSAGVPVAPAPSALVPAAPAPSAVVPAAPASSAVVPAAPASSPAPAAAPAASSPAPKK
jgi:hypothetical protein